MLPFTKVIKSESKRFFLAVVGRLHEDKLCGTSQGMVPTKVETVHKAPLFHIESNADRHGLLSPTRGQHSKRLGGRITLQSVLINKSKFLKATRYAEINEENCGIKVPGGGDLEPVKLARDPASNRPKTYVSLKTVLKILSVSGSLLALVGRKRTVVRDNLYPQKPPCLRLLTFAQRSSALPWLVDDRAALHPHRIWRLLTR